MSDNTYLSQQIITYMGNKRKLLAAIDDGLRHIQTELRQERLTVGDGFSGSGIVSRLFKTRCSALFTNDLAGYARTLNECYLSTPSHDQLEQIHEYIDAINDLDFADVSEPWVSQHWAPRTSTISDNDRVYFTHDNGRRIDVMRNFIANEVPDELKPYVLAPLLVETSIHNNTSGHFAAFYKGGYGGTKQVDLRRITQNIRIPYPVFSQSECDVTITQMDTNEWASTIPGLDVVYYDPPYNKHPYHIYYFLLDVVNNWDKTQDVPATHRGQPKKWTKSRYNSLVHAKTAMDDLIRTTRAKYIMLSYNSGGIIPLDELEMLLSKYGELQKNELNYSIYNRMKGLGEYKRKAIPSTASKEMLYILKRTLP